MICSNCGSEQPDQAKFCSFCGSALQATNINRVQQPQPQPRMQAQPQTNNYQTNYYQQPAAQYPPQYYGNQGQNLPYTQKPRKDKIVAVILAILLGDFGVHKFYLGDIRERGGSYYTEVEF